MKFLALLSLACVACLTRAAPVEEASGELKTGSCADAFALSAAGLAVSEINKDRQEGYILALHRLANVNQMTHGETGVVFYLTVDVVETDCYVLSKKNWRSCDPRPAASTPVYGQCKATIYVDKPQRVVRLYKYKCMIRPVEAAKLAEICPDCPTHISHDNADVVRTVSLSLDKFNKEGGQSNRFNLDKVTRAVSQGGIMEFYGVEYTIKESTCTSNDTTTDKCPAMECDFAHTGFCKSNLAISMGNEDITVDCTIYEPEAAEEQKKLHLLGGETDHSHTDMAAPPHDHAHSHDHTHDHTKDGHAGHGRGHAHGHARGHAHGHAHGQGHGHDHADQHDHVHSHHAKAHDHTGDTPNQHHQYAHTADVHTHDHDHEIALDHEHKHAHLHEHEHHHHHHPGRPAASHHHPEGMVIVLPPMDQPTTLPAFPDVPAAGPEVAATLPLVPDRDIPGQREPTIQPFPTAMAADCPAALAPEAGNPLVNAAFAADPMFKASA